MRVTIVLTVALVATTATSAAAQSSQFGVRGLGLPGRGLSARSLGSEGAYAHFDGTSSLNPASIRLLGGTTATVNSTGMWQSQQNDAGSGTVRTTRFPQLLIGGAVGSTPLAVALSYSTYTNRDFTLASATSDAPRGIPIPVTDTLNSRGGINDFRLAAAWRFTTHLAVGASVHFLTGSNRLSSRRVFEDTLYQTVQQVAELSYSGVGFSGGVLFQPSPRIAIGFGARTDGDLRVDRDSSRVGQVALPVSLTAGARFRPGRRLELAGEVIARGWHRADAGLREQGAIGASNTIEVAGGLELARNPRRPASFPLRAGVRFAQLPFQLTPGDRPTELGISLGTGTRFRPGAAQQDIAGIDLSLEHVSRRDALGRSENGWLLTFGLSIFAGGVTP